MAYATRTYTPGSSTTTFALTTSGGDPIGYIQESDISVKVNGATYTNAASGASTYQITGTSTVEQPNGGNVVLNAGVTGTVILERNTAIQDATVVYTAGSTLTSTDLNNADNQIRFGLQEFSDDYAALTSGTGNLTSLGAFKGGSDAWVSSDAFAATTAAIDGRVDAKIDTALTTDVSGGDGVTIVDNSPGAGQIRVDLDADIATLRNMQSGAATALAALTSTEVAILDGATLTTAELNYVDGVTSAVQTQLDNKQPLDSELTTLATMSAGTAGALKDLSQSEVEILDGATVSTAELNLLDGVPGTLTTAEIGYLDGVTSAVQTQLNAKQPLDGDLTAIAGLSSADGNFIVGSASGWVAESGATARTSLGAQTLAADLTTLSSCQSGASAALALLNSTEVAILDGATPSTTELNYVDGVTSAIQAQIDGKQPLDSELTTLSGMQAGTSSVLAAGTALAATTAEINSICENRAAETSVTNDAAKIPTSSAVVSYVTGAVTAVGGFVTVATEVTFPNSQPDADVVVSVADAGGLSINNSGVASGATTAGGSAVTITGIPNALYGGVGGNANPNVLVAGVGLQLVSSGSSNSYAYHKLLATEADVAQLSGDINDFNERYRVSNGVPSGTDHAGDLYYDTGSDKMLVRNAANNAWEEVQSIGNFYISSLSPTFNGVVEDFTVSNAPSNAQQLLISINGVVQKPNSGTSRPSEGFALNGSTVLFSTPPASNSDYFVVVIGSEVNIGAPSNNTVGNNQLMSGAVDNAKVAANAAIVGSKLADDSIAEVKLDIHNAPSGTDKYLKYTSNGMEWATVPAGVGGATGVDFNDGVKARWGTGNDLEIYFNGSNSFIKEPNSVAGQLIIDGYNGTDIRQGSTGENMIRAIGGGSVELYHNNYKTFQTTSTGIQVYGPEGTGGDIYLYADDGDDNADRWLISAGTDGTFALRNGASWDYSIKAVGDGAVELYYDNVKKAQTASWGFQVYGNFQLDDSNIAKFGNSGDLQIFHDGADATIDNNTGALYIKSNTSTQLLVNNTENAIIATANGAVQLYYDNRLCLATQTNGIQVTSTDSEATLRIKSLSQDGAAALEFIADNGDDHSDFWRLRADGGGNALGIQNYADSAWEANIVCRESGGAELYYDNSKKLDSKSDGVEIHGDALWGDNGKVKLGNSSDLLLFHDGIDNIISCQNDKDLRIVNDRAGGNETMIKCDPNGAVYLYNNGSLKLTVGGDLTVGTNTHLNPAGDNAQDLGSASYRWRNIYTTDLQLSNEGSANDVDETWGSYTIQEGADDLFLINRRNGKKYKFNLTEVS